MEETHLSCALTPTVRNRRIREIILKAPRHGVVTITLRSYFAANFEYTEPSWVYDYATEYAIMSQSEAVVESIEGIIAREFSRDESPYHTAIIRVFDRLALDDRFRFLAWVLPLIRSSRQRENAK